MNRFELIPELIDAMDLKIGVTLGVEAGRYDRHLLENSLLDHLFMIDLWQKNPSPDEPINILNYDQSFRRTVRHVLIPHKERCSIIRDDTVKAADFFENESIDFLYVDANQTFEGMYNNFVAWFPKCRTGALMCMKNYHHKYSYTGTREAIDKVSAEYSIPFKLTEEKYPTAYFIKP